MTDTDRMDQSQPRAGEHTFFTVTIATTVQAGLQVVDVHAATGRTNHSKVATGSDVNSLRRGNRKSHDSQRERGGRSLEKHRCNRGVTVAMLSLREAGGRRW